MIAGIQFPPGIDAQGPVVIPEMFGDVLHRPEDGMPGLCFLVPQGQIDALRRKHRSRPFQVVLHAGIPQGSGHAGTPGEKITPGEGIQGEQPRHGISGDGGEGGISGNAATGFRKKLLPDPGQMSVGPAGKGRILFRQSGSGPRGQIVVPVKVPEDEKGEIQIRTCLRDPVAFLRKTVQDDKRPLR